MVKNDKIIFTYRILAGLIFIYIFTHLLEMSDKDWVCHAFRKWIINSSSCITLYLIINLAIFCYLDRYVGMLCFIIIITQYRTALKEFFNTDNFINTTPTPTPTPTSTLTPTIRNQYDIPQNTNSTLLSQLGVDDRFKLDNVAKDEILKQIKAQIEFDPYKSNLAKNVIGEIYSKYYDNSIFTKLKDIVDDSQTYIASGNFKYLPTNDKTEYDLTTYQNLNNNVQFGINPIIDGIGNTTASS